MTKELTCTYMELKKQSLEKPNFNKCHKKGSSLTYTGLFISPSGISELDCATTKTDTAERSISI